MKHALAVILLVAAPAAVLVAQEPPPAQPPAPSTYRPVKDVWVLQMQNPPREYAVRLESLQSSKF